MVFAASWQSIAQPAFTIRPLGAVGRLHTGEMKTGDEMVNLGRMAYAVAVAIVVTAGAAHAGEEARPQTASVEIKQTAKILSVPNAGAFQHAKRQRRRSSDARTTFDTY